MITVNGKTIEWIEGETISKLLSRMNYIFPLVIIKINGTLIPRKNYASTIIPDNAKIDIIHMISGG